MELAYKPVRGRQHMVNLNGKVNSGSNIWLQTGLKCIPRFQLEEILHDGDKRGWERLSFTGQMENSLYARLNGVARWQAFSLCRRNPLTGEPECVAETSLKLGKTANSKMMETFALYK